MANKPSSAGWNPWHGCTKLSTGCKYCYVYRQDAKYGSEKNSAEVSLNADFNLPVRRKRDGSYKLAPGTMVYTCFTSDFLLDKADEWRPEAWRMMRQRDEMLFYFFTKRIDRLEQSLPPDWGEGYPNVIIGCTVENQAMVNYRLPIFNRLPIRHKTIIVAPMLEVVDLSPFLNRHIEEVAVSGESGLEARPCDYAWVLDVRRQCMAQEIPFCFHQTGAHFLKNGKLYNVPRRYQMLQAYKANINYRIDKSGFPLTAEED